MRNAQSGITMLELTVVVAVLGIMVLVAGLYLRAAEAPLQTGTVLLDGLFRQARAKAMATTSAYRIVPVTTGRVEAEWAPNCAAATWVRDDDLVVEMPGDVYLGSTAWTTCFTSRGISTANLTLTLLHPEFGSRQIEVLRGGTTRILQ